MSFDHLSGGDSGKVAAAAAMASERPSRMRSWAGLPMTVWSRSRISISTWPSGLATGPRLPTWQSPQIQMGGPSGSVVSGTGLEPLVKFERIAADVGVGGARHLEAAVVVRAFARGSAGR